MELETLFSPNAMGSAGAGTSADQLWRLHHLGYVVASIEAVGDRFARTIGAVWKGKIIHDPLQVAKVSFIEPPNPFCATVELVEPAGENSPVERFLKRGGGLHHLCYEVDDLERHLKLSRSMGSMVVRQPVPAVAFDGRRIAWVFTKDKLLLEFLEATKTVR
jgi:methylmalonyl-CoA/ethylmalonyl-CoA epimerase